MGGWMSHTRGEIVSPPPAPPFPSLALPHASSDMHNHHGNDKHHNVQDRDELVWRVAAMRSIWEDNILTSCLKASAKWGPLLLKRTTSTTPRTTRKQSLDHTNASDQRRGITANKTTKNKKTCSTSAAIGEHHKDEHVRSSNTVSARATHYTFNLRLRPFFFSE